MTSLSLRTRILRGDAVFGAWVFSPDPSITEILGQCGLDFSAVDMEHAGLTHREVVEHIRAGKAAGMPVIVRVPDSDPGNISRVLDAGAEGVIVPHVTSAADVDRIRAATRYAPAGSRPTCTGVPSNRYGLGNLAESALEHNDRALFVGLIEDAEAFDDLDALAASDIDVLFPGPSDLASSFGFPGQLAHPQVEAALDSLMTAAQGSSAVAGAYLSNVADAARWHAQGARFFIYSIDYKLIGSLYRGARQEFDAVMADVRAEVGQSA